MASLTLLDIAKLRNTDDVTGLIEESIQAHPETIDGAARTISGLSYDVSIRKTLPVAGFRDANEGVAAVKSTFRKKRVETFIIDVQVETDRAVADAHEDGPEAIMAIEAGAQLEAAFRAISSQMYYGRISTAGASSTAADFAKGFPGLVDTVDSALTKAAGGTGGSDLTSIWLVKWGPQDTSWVFGKEGAIDVSEVSVVRVTDSASNPYDAYRQTILAYAGLQQTNLNSVVRIKEIDDGSFKVTDDLIYQGLELYPTGMDPDFIYMNKRSLRQLRESRTATNLTGFPAPRPTEVEGIPIRLTDSIVNTETA